MFTSCGIQWFAHVARYFSQAHLYLNGTNWFTSVWPLMMRLSAAVTRRALVAEAELACAGADAGVGAALGAGAPSFKVRIAATDCMAGVAERGGNSIERLEGPLARGDGDEGLTSSSQFSIKNYPMCEL
jgi:hypothetical protein